MSSSSRPECVFRDGAREFHVPVSRQTQSAVDRDQRVIGRHRERSTETVVARIGPRVLVVPLDVQIAVVSAAGPLEAQVILAQVGPRVLVDAVGDEGVVARAHAHGVDAVVVRKEGVISRRLEHRQFLGR